MCGVCVWFVCVCECMCECVCGVCTGTCVYDVFMEGRWQPQVKASPSVLKHTLVCLCVCCAQVCERRSMAVEVRGPPVESVSPSTMESGEPVAFLAFSRFQLRLCRSAVVTDAGCVTWDPSTAQHACTVRPSPTEASPGSPPKPSCKVGGRFCPPGVWLSFSFHAL